MNDVQKLKSGDSKKFSLRERHCKSFRNKTGKDTFFPNVELEYLFEEGM